MTRSPVYLDSTEEANRAEWFLREHGRFPTVLELIAIREHREDEQANLAQFREVFERSSFGTPAARALRNSVADDVARTVVQRSRELMSARHGSR